jgi:hypothetical protein
VSEQRLHVAHVVGVAKHRHGSCAAEVVRGELASDADGHLEFSESVGRGVLAVMGTVAHSFGLAANPELADEGQITAEIALADEAFHFRGDWEGQLFAAFGGEGESVSHWLVVLGRQARGGAAADGEVRAEEQSQLEVRRRRGQERVNLAARGGDIARAHVRIAAHVLVELGGAELFPQEAEDAPQGIRFFSFGLIGERAVVDGVVDFGHVSGADAARVSVILDTTRQKDQ